jgi:hypothetical protein
VVERVWPQFEDLGEFEANAIEVAALDPDAVVAKVAAGLHDRFLLSP